MSLIILFQGTAVDNRNVTMVLTGGGAISIARVKAAMATAAIKGGGITSISWTTSKTGTHTIKGGGVITANASKQGATITNLTGGGRVTITGQHGSSVTVSLTGGGRVTATSQKGGFMVGGPTGGGVIVWQYEVPTGVDNRNVTFNVTGGGDIEIVYDAIRPGELVIEVAEDPQMTSGAGPATRDRITEFDDWTLVMDDEAVVELYALRKTR